MITMHCGVYNRYKNKMYGNISVKAGRKEMEVCYSKVLFVDMKLYNIPSR